MVKIFSKIWVIGILAVVFASGFFAWWNLSEIKATQITSDAIFSSINQPNNAIIDLQKCNSESKDCVIPVMRKYKASQVAIDFFNKTGWFMADFQEMGKVDLARIVTPWRANDNEQAALVNGSPQIVYIEEEAGNFSEKLVNFNKVVGTFPKYTFWSGDYGYIRQEGESFLFKFDLKNGCHACSTGYWAIVSFDFQNGNYLGPKLLDFCVDDNIKDSRFLPCSSSKFLK
ncbi:MAG: hypothetical protein V1649_04560 [Patescibacteria group bacterium]